MTKKIKIFLQNLMLFFISLIISLILIEIILRLFFPQNLNYTMFDENLMYKHIPNLEFRHFRQEFDNVIKFNSKGLRDFEYNYDKNKGIYRILILGDSVPEALQVKLNESFPKILEKKLNKQNNGYEVINAGIGGYGTENELLFFENEGIKYNPDLVILTFVLNDIDDNLLSPLITMQNNQLVKNTPLKISLPKNFMLYCSRYSHTCALGQSVLLQGLKENEFLRIFFDKIRISSKGKSEKITKKPGLDVYLKENSEIFKKGLNETFLTFSEFDQVMKNNKIKFVILLVPSREQVDESKCNEFIKNNNLDKNSLDPTKVQKLVAGFAKENQIDVLDMLPYFKQENINNTFYFNIDGHWNAKGHELAADLLYNYLKNNYLKNGKKPAS